MFHFFFLNFAILRSRSRFSRVQLLMSLPFLFRLSTIFSACFNSKKTTAKYGVHSVKHLLSGLAHHPHVISALGHCYLMQDDLQKAYSAYQQALYLLPNPKVRPPFPSTRTMCHAVSYRRIQSSGTVSVYSTTDTVPWIMPRKHLHLFSRWTKVGWRSPPVWNLYVLI